MIEINNDSMVFSFPEVHASATLEIEFQRTLRIPDDDKDYPLPPGLGSFPLRHVDDFSQTISKSWIKHGGIVFPMYQSEAMWINFNGRHDSRRGTAYPFAVKIAAGKINAITGEKWEDETNQTDQNYCVVPGQPWLDGYCVEKGVIRQFVAIPLGAGYTAEEQITGTSEFGGLQIQVFPMRREIFEKRFPLREEEPELGIRFMMDDCAAPYGMGLAPGGRMKQEIKSDPYDQEDWDLGNTSRCFVHIENSMVWQSITGSQPPFPPPTAKSYSDAGLPWFDWYDENSAPLSGSMTLSNLKSVAKMGAEKGEVPLPENEPAVPTQINTLHA